MIEKITFQELFAMKKKAEKIVSLTAYDASFAALLDAAGVEVVLVGDSLGMVLQGEANTLDVSMDDMVYHTRLVSKTCKRAMLVSDLPFQSYETKELALHNAERLVQAGAKVVKLEGGVEMQEVVEHLCANNIEVCGHVGLQPQSVELYGGYKVQGRDENSARRIMNGALALQSAGAKMVVLECIPADLAEQVTAALNIPTIGIGAGVACDGQVLVLYDLLGVSIKSPHMAKNFLAESGNISDAIRDYVSAVKSGDFPAIEHSFK
ncbi:MAG: 3-methyl-2-oxobutanoate hydroxymethyltransferase [Gammaproteobacteria bacterium]|nr:3-methyl-2-oxobutanoate hydroxymethyltransferase [Gammaproteobacteria bacterium]